MQHRPILLNRRSLLASTAIVALAPGLPLLAVAPAPQTFAQAIPLNQVRLLPSLYLDAIEANRLYLMALEPDRLLHNFHTLASLEPKGEIYGGWESDTIAGHMLGHYLTALSLMHAQTGDAQCKARTAYIVAELAEVQRAHGDGYVAGFTRKRDDIVENGKLLFAEIMAGDIRSLGFDLNGCWVPLYNWHKLFAGLFAAETWCGNTQARAVALGLAGYIDNVFAVLSDTQVQQVLDCEHGGINESMAELHVRTGDPRWLRLAERLRHKKVLDPLSSGIDSVKWIHANTQIPKVIGLARLHEVTGDAGNARAARFFWETVTRDYSYVIGGNADREYFTAPQTVSKHITEQTCESCNTYNMLKLTRHVYSWRPEARLFDYYERAHLNHIMAHQDPETGMFAYMVPLMSGSHRTFSKPFDHFWCCVGSGIESHAKHGESIWWEHDDGLIANLYIPSETIWSARAATLRIETAYPFGDSVNISVVSIDKPGDFTLSLRTPGWCTSPALSVNGEAISPLVRNGYLAVRRTWQAGDRIELTLPMALRIEATSDDASMVALLHGPTVLAADVGPTDQPFEGMAPAFVADNLLPGFAAINAKAGLYRSTGTVRPGDLNFAPFFLQRHNRTAVYFKRFTPAEWESEEAQLAQAAAEERDLAARSVDVMHLGEMQPERDHDLKAKDSFAVTYRGRHGRDARNLGFFEWTAKVRSGPLVLQATYWGEERGKLFDIFIDGTRIATQKLEGERPGTFFSVDYPIPEALTRHKQTVVVRVQPSNDRTRAAPTFGMRIFTPKAATQS